MNPFLTVKADIRKHFVSLLGVFLLLTAACSVQFAVSGLSNGIVEALSNISNGFDLVIGAPGSKTDLVLSTVFLQSEETLPLLDSEYLEDLKNDERVANFSPVVFSDSWEGYKIIGVGKDIFKTLSFLCPDADLEGFEGYKAIAGASVPLSPGDEFEGVHSGSGHHHEAQRWSVIEKLEGSGSPWDRAVLVPYETLWSIHGIENGGISAILVKPASFADAYSLRSSYLEGGTIAAFPGEVLSAIFGTMFSIKEIADFISLMIEILVSAAAVLSLLASMSSKYRWIGILRALGADRLYIFISVWSESAVLFFLSGLAGLGCGYLLSSSILDMMAASSGIVMTAFFDSGDAELLLWYYLIGALGSLIPAAAGFKTSPKAVLQK